MSLRHVMLVSEAATTCGVEEFARQSARHLGVRGATVPLGRPVGDADDVVLNLPITAWKKRLVAPIIAAARARLARRDVTIVLHEWADLKLARRISYLPLLPLATRLMFSAPEVQAQFEATPLSRIVTRRRCVLPIPPNFTVPDTTEPSAIADALAAARAGGGFILAQFGSIYPKKDPLVLLEIGAELLRRGVDTRIVFIGSFIKDMGNVEADFFAEADRLGLAGRVEVTGYVKSAAELYGIFAEVDAFLYPLSEGLTSRRASVQAAALSGKPVVVSAPARADSLTHHRLMNALIASGALQFVPRGANAAAFADAVLATRGLPIRPLVASREIDAAWDDLTAALDA
ncbi:MAG: glycosyltransferase [Hyphomicrobiales bacterium]|nr:MAG: glycosyltransferase [Hyphomicrobiales bacterium]